MAPALIFKLPADVIAPALNKLLMTFNVRLRLEIAPVMPGMPVVGRILVIKPLWLLNMFDALMTALVIELLVE